jgi:hypothetical protein
MTFTQSSSRLAALTVGAAAIVAVAFSAATAVPALAAVCPGTTFSTNLKMGASSSAVMALQQFLNMSADTQIAATGAGSPGSETNYFGGLTKAAVNKFQVKYAAQILTPNGLTTPTGNFYASSRAQANAVCAGSTSTGTGTGTSTGTASGTAVVSAAAQPANTIAPAGAARVPFTAFTVTANGAPVTLNSVTVQRQGPSVDSDIAGVVLIDASTGVQVGNSRILDSNHSAVIGSAITIPAGTSKTFWVAANISPTTANGGNLTTSGDIASFAVTAINTASSVSASFPITGASNTINASLAIGSATITSSSFDPAIHSSQPVGTTGYRFSGLRIQAQSVEDLTFHSITWYNSGSASGLQNVNTVVNGTSYPAMVDSTGRYYTSVFPSGIVIPKGQSVDVYVTADLGANATANTTAEFDVYRNTDIYLTGNQYGFGITPGGSTFGSGSVNATPHDSVFLGGTNTPFFQGSAVTVTGGTFSTIQNATSVGAQNIAINVPNQPLGGFQTNLTGEAIQVQTLKVHFFVTGGAISPLQNISLVDENGNVAAGSFNATCDSGASTCTAQTVALSGATTFPTGTHTYTIKGQVQSQAGINGFTIVASTTPSSSTDWSNVTGATTGNTVQPGVGLFTMNPMTIQAASLVSSNGTSPTSGSTVVSGGQNVLFATVQLDASQSGENVRLSSVPVTIVMDSTASSAFLSSCQIWNGTTALNTGSRVVNSSNLNLVSGTTYSATFSFDNSLTIPKGTVMNLPITCNLSSGAPNTATYAFGLGTITGATGVTSGSTVTVGAANGSVPTLKVASNATVTASTDSSSPASTIVAGGTSGVVLNVIKLRATNEPVNLQKVGLALPNTTSAPSVTTAYIYSGNNLKTTAGVAIPSNTLLGTATFTSGAVTATSTLSVVAQLPADQDSTLIIKADLAPIGVNKPGSEATTTKIDYDSARGVGANSGKTIDSAKIAGFAGSAGVRTFAAFPTVAAGPAGTVNPNGNGQVIKKFSISANSGSTIGLDKVSFSIATSSGITLTNVKLIAYTDNGYSNAANVPGTSSGLFGPAIPNVTSGSTITFTQDGSGSPAKAPLEISGTEYFALVGDVAVNTANGSWTISATLLGDATADQLKVPGSLSPNNFVWSGNATSTAQVTDYDWANGFGVAGLPSTGL